MKFYTVVEGKCLHELKSYAASRKMCVRISVVGSFGIKDGYGGWQYVVGHMVITDNEIDPFLFCISDFIDSFDTAIEYND